MSEKPLEEEDYDIMRMKLELNVNRLYDNP